ncbi:Arc family DNA-binding protein [Sinorhizobium medicae]|nr:Arc family DNA-binding protein [Sinorhizobium medicae]MDX0560506.1 Arc family DNA-binding protein [Sinorhizobium medicae]MDX0573232.1 Arc family DNA-binding protein [Sinorhizobium medicae]MDX0592003.1 Arc family DNA-binding protein [Sinorhizobium medicae]MDX0630119.1 Arc family DNA-binding protein [Sinorhizobium medicae]
MPEDLKNKIQAEAERNHRSMTAEILARFESKFEPSGSTEISKAILELRSEVQELRKLRESALLQQKEHQ